MGFFNYDFETSQGRIKISEQGWVYLAITFPLTVMTLSLSYAWMWWTSTEQRRGHVRSGAAKVPPQVPIMGLGGGKVGTV
jgi:hypothetical protein